jgi:hypothetical protein
VNNSGLRQYIVGVAKCYNISRGAAKHAQFMLGSQAHCAPFVARMILQYIQEKILFK